MVPFPWSHPLFQPKPGNIGVLDLTESTIICPTSSPPDQDHLRKGRIFHLKNPMRLFPLFFPSIQAWNLLLLLSLMSQSSWQGSLDTRNLIPPLPFILVLPK